MFLPFFSGRARTSPPNSSCLPVSADRCPFLDPVKSKHIYRVPLGGRPNYPPTPVFHEAVDPASMAAQMYSSIASSKAKKAAADAAIDAERQRLNSAAGGGRGRKGGPLVLQFPPSLKVHSSEGCRKAPQRDLRKTGGARVGVRKHLNAFRAWGSSPRF